MATLQVSTLVGTTPSQSPQAAVTATTAASVHGAAVELVHACACDFSRSSGAIQALVCANHLQSLLEGAVTDGGVV